MIPPIADHLETQALAEARAAAREGLLQGFGRGLAVPKRDYSLAELRLNKIEPTACAQNPCCTVPVPARRQAACK